MTESSTQQPCLTVLGGPMAGTRLVLEDTVDEVLIGSDPACRFCIPLPGVNAVHARLWVDGNGITLFDTNSPQGLYVNDDRVVGSRPLRNGDILWLGSPGASDVPMIQCRLPRAAAVSTATPVPEPESEPEPEPEPATVLPSFEEDPSAEGVVEEVAASPDWTETVAEAPPAFAAQPFVIEEVDPPPEVPADPVEPLPAETAHPANEGFPEFADEFEEALLDATRRPPAEPSPDPDPLLAQDESPGPDQTQPFMSAPDASPSEDDLGETVSLPRPPPPTVTPPTPVPVAAAPAAPVSTATPVPRAVAAAPGRSSGAATTTPRPVVARTAGARGGRPAPAPVRGKKSGNRLLPVIAAGVVLLLIGGGFAAYRFLPSYFGRQSAASVDPTSSTPSTVAAAPVTEPPAAGVPATPAPEPTAVAQALPGSLPPALPPPETAPPPKTLAAPSPPAPTPTPKAGATPSPVPKPSASPRTAPSVAPTAPPHDARPVATGPDPAQVASLIGQAQAAMGARSYDAAAGLYDQVLKIDPQNAAALAGRAGALSAKSRASRTFVASRTAVQTDKAARGSLDGFDSSGVSVMKAPDFQGRVEFLMTPTVPQPGDPYSLKLYVINEGKKSIKVSSLTVTMAVNGKGSGGPVTPATREIAPQQRVLVADLPGTWPADVSSWAADVTVSAGKGDSLRSQLTWK